MNRKQLKNSILQWAIQGKLVPQCPTDEPATLLLQRIAKQKAELVKQKKIKKDKNETQIFKGEDNLYYEKTIATSQINCINEEIPFEIPEGWSWCRLGNVISISSGENLTSKEMKEGNIPVFGGNGITGFHDKANIHEETIVIGRVGFYCGSVHLTPKEAWVTDNAFITKFSPCFYRDYLVTLLKSMNLGKSYNATAQPVVSGKKIYPMLFPLPPLAEQKRIVERLQELLPLVEKYSKNQAQLEALNASLKPKLKKSILQLAIQGKLVPQCPTDEPATLLLQRIAKQKAELVKQKKIKKDKNETQIFKGEDNLYYEKTIATGKINCINEEIPFEIPEGWCWCRLGNIGDWGAGATPLKSNPKYYGGEIPWLRTGELNNGIVYDTEFKITELALKECSLRMNKIGDVLIAMYGATIGKLAIAGKELTTNQACCACTPIEVNNYYLFYFLMASQTEFIKKGEGGAQPNISREKLIAHLFPLPPLAEQKRIVEHIQELFKKLE